MHVLLPSEEIVKGLHSAPLYVSTLRYRYGILTVYTRESTNTVLNAVPRVHLECPDPATSKAKEIDSVASIDISEF